MVRSHRFWFHSPRGPTESSSGLSLLSEEGAWGSPPPWITESPALTVQTPRQRRGGKQRWQGQTRRSQLLPSTAPFFLVLFFPSKRGLEHSFSPSAPSRTLGRAPPCSPAPKSLVPGVIGALLPLVAICPVTQTDGWQDGAARCQVSDSHQHPEHRPSLI